ncbi:MAG: META domain-containing protein [Nocardioides sp.]
MRNSKVHYALAAIVAVVALAACDDSQPRIDSLGHAQAPANLSELEGGVWVADSVLDPHVSLVPGSQIEMRFESDSLSADAGCNRMFGGASIEGEDLVVPALASTQKACDDALTQQDAWLTEFLSSRPSIEVLDHDLWLSHGNDSVIHLVHE